MKVLSEYSWPGNVRELQSVLKQALVHAVGSTLLLEFLPPLPGKGRTPVNGVIAPAAADSTILGFGRLGEFVEDSLHAGSDNLYEETLRRMEKLLLVRVLETTGGNQLQAAKILGITRGSLRTKLRDLGITIQRTVGNEDEAN
jgi:two-component system nitrogen regulation response regulator GlnG